MVENPPPNIEEGRSNKYPDLTNITSRCKKNFIQNIEDSTLLFALPTNQKYSQIPQCSCFKSKNGCLRPKKRSHLCTF